MSNTSTNDSEFGSSVADIDIHRDALDFGAAHKVVGKEEDGGGKASECLTNVC